MCTVSDFLIDKFCLHCCSAALLLLCEIWKSWHHIPTLCLFPLRSRDQESMWGRGNGRPPLWLRTEALSEAWLPAAPSVGPQSQLHSQTVFIITINPTLSSWSQQGYNSSVRQFPSDSDRISSTQRHDSRKQSIICGPVSLYFAKRTGLTSISDANHSAVLQSV